MKYQFFVFYMKALWYKLNSSASRKKDYKTRNFIRFPGLLLGRKSCHFVGLLGSILNQFSEYDRLNFENVLKTVRKEISIKPEIL